MNKILKVSLLIFLIAGCAPVETPIPATSTATAVTPSPTATLTPSPTPSPTPTLALPVGYSTPIPLPNEQITRENLPKLREIARYYGDIPFVSAVTKDGKELFIRDQIGLYIYDYETRELLSSINLWNDWRLKVRMSLTISLNGEWALVDERWLIHFILGRDLEALDLQTIFPPSNEWCCQNFSLSPDGRLILVTDFSKPGSFDLLTLPDFQPIYSWKGGYNDLHGTYPVFSPDGSLISTYIDNRIIMWDVSDQRRVAAIKNIQGRPQVAFSEDNSLIAIGQFDTIQLWDVASGENRQTIKVHCGSLYSPPQPLFVTANEVVVWECFDYIFNEGIVSIWRTTDGNLVYKSESQEISPSRIRYENGEISLIEYPRKTYPWVTGWSDIFQYIENGSLVIGNDEFNRDKNVREFTTCILDFRSEARCFSSVILGGDEKFYYYSSENNSIVYYEGFAKNDNPVFSLNAKIENVNIVDIVSFDPSTGFLFYNYWLPPNEANASANALQMDANKLTEWKRSFISELAISENKKLAALCREVGNNNKLDNDRLTFFDMVAKTVILDLPFSCSPQVLNGDGSVFMAGYWESIPGSNWLKQSLFILNPYTPNERKKVEIFDDASGGAYINAMIFSRNEEILILACHDGTIRFLDPETVAEIYRIENIDPDISNLSMSADGHFLALQSRRGYISIWAIPPFNVAP